MLLRRFLQFLLFAILLAALGFLARKASTVNWGLGNVCAARIEDSAEQSRLLSEASAKAPAWRISRERLVTGNREEATGILVLPPDPKVIVVYFPGGKAMAVDQIERLYGAYKDLPVAIWITEYSGCGFSSSTASLAATFAQSAALLDKMHGRFPDLPIVLHGMSYGTLIASVVANSHLVEGMVLESAITSFRNLLERQIGNRVPHVIAGLVPIDLHDGMAELDARSAMRRSCKATLILQGENDDLAPMSFAQGIRSASGCESKVEVIETPGGHDEVISNATARMVLTEFILKFARESERRRRRASKN